MLWQIRIRSPTLLFHDHGSCTRNLTRTLRVGGRVGRSGRIPPLDLCRTAWTLATVPTVRLYRRHRNQQVAQARMLKGLTRPCTIQAMRLGKFSAEIAHCINLTLFIALTHMLLFPLLGMMNHKVLFQRQAATASNRRKSTLASTLTSSNALPLISRRVRVHDRLKGREVYTDMAGNTTKGVCFSRLFPSAADD